jgi:hypothetical protein
MTETTKRGEPEKRKGPKANEPGDPAGKEHEREKLIRDPNLNQAGNERGSLDQTQGSQTGNDIDVIPEP